MSKSLLEIFENLFLQEVRIKYRRTYLGYLWSLLNPLLHLTVISFVFAHVVKFPIKDYTLYLFSGLFVWTFFQGSVLQSSTAILENEAFIKKVYIPKFLFPLSKTAFNFFNFVFSFVAMMILGLILGFPFHKTLLLLPIAFTSLFLFTLGCASFLSIASVYFRDLQQILGVLLQLLYFATPIMYPAASLPDSYRLFLDWNPLYSQLRIFHELIYFGTVPAATTWLYAFGTAFIFLGAGLYYLNLKESTLVLEL